MLAIDKDEIEVELPQNVDHPWGREGKVVAVSLASGTRGGFDPVGLLHPMSSSVRRLRSDHVILSMFGRCQRTLHRESRSSKMRRKGPNGQRPLCADSEPSRPHPETGSFVKGFRTPASHWRAGVYGGRRPKSLEGGNRGGVCAGGGVGLWGFSAGVCFDVSSSSREGRLSK